MVVGDVSGIDRPVASKEFSVALSEHSIAAVSELIANPARV